MSSKSDIDAYREKVFAAMREAGFPIDQWHREYEEDLAANPTAKSRPFTKITPPKFGKIQKLRPGFEEFIPHPRHGKPVPRCQAARKLTVGKEQCRKFAANGTHLCGTHGGAKGSGKLTEQGRENQIASVTKHGDETIAKRQARSLASKVLKTLEKRMRENGMMTGLGSRGPYYKANRVGKPTGCQKRQKKS